MQEIHHRIADARTDYSHKISTEISKKHAMVAMEDLKVAGMRHSGLRRLNKKILDQGWYEFRRQLEYSYGEEERLFWSIPVIPQEPAQNANTYRQKTAHKLSLNVYAVVFQRMPIL